MALVSRHQSVADACQNYADQQTILAAATPTSNSHYYQTSLQQNNHTSHQAIQPDKPIGYGAFGVVWAVTDPRTRKRVALKKLPNVFQNLISAKRVYRELRLLCQFKHDNLLSAIDILRPQNDFFQEIYVVSELMQSDLHKIIVSPQPLSIDHIKVFTYQILRGLKYLHSAKVIHRDIKPGNLLVNSDCCLKICDFGLARVAEPNENRHMTQEVVTQYYRAPELLMGAKHYTTSIDIWSVGCIFAELLSRRILFQAASPVEQLSRITDLLGTPGPEDMKSACSAARNHMLRSPTKPMNLSTLYSLSTHTTHDAVHLLSRMLVFRTDRRITAEESLRHPYLEEGRLRYHSCMCNCCSTSLDGNRQATIDFEPICSKPFTTWEMENGLHSLASIREKLSLFIMEQQTKSKRVQLCINPNSAAFKSFVSSQVAQANELPPSPHLWEV